VGIACSFIATHVDAQVDPRAVQPERPTVATHAYTVAPGYVELETGGQWDRYDGGLTGFGVPSVFKFGVAPRVQFSAFVPLVRPPGSSTSGIGDMGAGLKVRLADDHPVLGRFALQPSVTFHSGSVSTGAGTGTTAASILLISSHDVGPVTIDANAGYTRRSGDGTVAPRSSTVWTVSSGGAIARGVGWVLETFGYPRTTGPAGNASSVGLLFGPTLVVAPAHALGAGANIPLSGSRPRSWYAGGVVNLGRFW
jgi:hypothetical protein